MEMHQTFCVILQNTKCSIYENYDPERVSQRNNLDSLVVFDLAEQRLQQPINL